MKHILSLSLVVGLLLLNLSDVSGQELYVNQINLADIETEYIEVEIITYLGGGRGVKARVDYGQICQSGRKDCELVKDLENNAIAFSQRIEVINAIAQAGWEMVGATNANDTFIQLYFRRKTSAQTEAHSEE